MGDGGQGPSRERATEGAERSEGAMPHRQFTIYFTTGAHKKPHIGRLWTKVLATSDSSEGLVRGNGDGVGEVDGAGEGAWHRDAGEVGGITGVKVLWET